MVSGSANRRDHECYTHIEDLHMTNPYNITLKLMHAILVYTGKKLME